MVFELQGKIGKLSFVILTLDENSKFHMQQLSEQEIIRAAMGVIVGKRKKLTFAGSCQFKRFRENRRHIEFNITTHAKYQFWVILDYESSENLKTQGIVKERLRGQACEIVFFN